MHVLVLGGTGWVGHHIAQTFHDAGYEVAIGSRGAKADFLDALPEGVRILRVDKTREEDMARIFREPFDTVVDSVPTDTSIDLVRRHARKLRRYLHCSSTGGYAPLPRVPGDETLPYDGFMGGWVNKAAVDAQVLDLCCREGFPATVIRPCYITGPGKLPLDNFGGRHPDFIRDILDEKTLDLPNDGQSLLQPIHVQDLADAFLLAAEEERSIGQIYNICLDKAVPLTRYIEITAAALDRAARIRLVPVEDILAKQGDTISERGLRFMATHMCFDISKARGQLGYRPHCSTEEAIEETARWAASRIGTS